MAIVVVRASVEELLVCSYQLGEDKPPLRKYGY
jgi:hypothetical protein